MEIDIDNKKLNWNQLMFDVRLMAQERIFGEFLRKDKVGLGWFRGYQQVDLRRIESILEQAKEQYKSLPEAEKSWIDDLDRFYEDFRSFDWEIYDSIKNDNSRRLYFETEVALGWARKVKDLIKDYQLAQEKNSHLNYDPFEHLLLRASIEDDSSPNNILIPKN